jgi:hypothetical protein
MEGGKSKEGSGRKAVGRATAKEQWIRDPIDDEEST